jgi:hypothetical protein
MVKLAMKTGGVESTSTNFASKFHVDVLSKEHIMAASSPVNSYWYALNKTHSQCTHRNTEKSLFLAKPHSTSLLTQSSQFTPLCLKDL